MKDSQGKTKSVIDVQVLQSFEGLRPEEHIKCMAEHILSLLGNQNVGSLSIVLVDDGTIRGLNKYHRGLDENTDVLSFSFSHEGEYYGDGAPQAKWAKEDKFSMPPGESAILGEVIISCSEVEREALGSGYSTNKVLAKLLIHGVLHLLGYDHQEPVEESMMKEQETRLLAQVYKHE